MPLDKGVENSSNFCRFRMGKEEGMQKLKSRRSETAFSPKEVVAVRGVHATWREHGISPAIVY